MSTIEYAMKLDWEQQTELELEDVQPLDKVEHKAFVERCRRAKVPYTKLKKYEQEVDAKTKELNASIEDLEWKLKHCSVGERRNMYASIYTQKDFDQWRKQLSSYRRKVEQIVKHLHNKYFT